MKKQNFVKITKDHAIITIHFETLKICYFQVLRKSTKTCYFRVGHREVNPPSEIISPYQKMTVKVFPLVLSILTNL
mgnify:CR=1 FL=1